MRQRGWLFPAALAAALALASCGGKDAAKQQQRNAPPASTLASVGAVRVAQLLDPCQVDGQGFAQKICANRTLAALDTQIRATLQTQSEGLSGDGARILVQNQQRWREQARIACGLLDAGGAVTPNQQTCLESQFRARVNDVRNSVQQIGGYTFERVELTDAAPVTAALRASSGLGDDAPPAIIRDIRYPRIDAPQTPEAQRFNEQAAQEPEYRLQDNTSETVNYQIAFAGPNVISVRFDSSADMLGGAHPSNSSKAVTVMMQSGALLQASDVFRAGSGWEDFLTQRAVADLTRQFKDYDFAPAPSDVRETVTKPHLWLVTADALVLVFPPYSFGGPTALAGTQVSIPWSELRRYLNPHAPAPIRASA